MMLKTNLVMAQRIKRGSVNSENIHSFKNCYNTFLKHLKLAFAF